MEKYLDYHCIQFCSCSFIIASICLIAFLKK